MSKTIRVAVYEAHGNPAEVLRVVERPWPLPAADEVVVQMRAAPINPADVNAIEGKYPIRQPLPATPGMEGAGVVVELGAAVRDLALGDQVILPHNLGTWREACAVKAEQLVVVPMEIEPVNSDVEDKSDHRLANAARLCLVSPRRMVHPERGQLRGRASRYSDRARAGYRSVNVVRRRELFEELQAEGADVVVLDREELRDEVKEKTEGAPIRLALNAVGGESALRMAKTLDVGRHDRDLRRNEPSAAHDSEWDADLQESEIHRVLGEQMVRAGEAGGADENVCGSVRDGEARIVAE